MNCSKTGSEFAQDIDCSFDDLLLWGTGLFKECLDYLLFISVYIKYIAKKTLFS